MKQVWEHDARKVVSGGTVLGTTGGEDDPFGTLSVLKHRGRFYAYMSTGAGYQVWSGSRRECFDELAAVRAANSGLTYAYR